MILKCYICRTFAPCAPTGTCDWIESTTEALQSGRWYATNQLLPDGRQFIIGGRAIFTWEFLPANGQQQIFLPFLNGTADSQPDNLYPYVHLLPDGTLYIFANRDSIIYNYKTNTVVKYFPAIPGEPRNYPSAGSSVMLPLLASNGYSVVEVLICGGAKFGAFTNPGAQYQCSTTCGRMTIFDPAPGWAMEEMPYPRCMGDMILLPSREILIINGAQQGSSRSRIVRRNRALRTSKFLLELIIVVMYGLWIFVHVTRFCIPLLSYAHLFSKLVLVNWLLFKSRLIGFSKMSISDWYIEYPTLCTVSFPSVPSVPSLITAVDSLQVHKDGAMLWILCSIRCHTNLMLLRDSDLHLGRLALFPACTTPRPTF